MYSPIAQKIKIKQVLHSVTITWCPSDVKYALLMGLRFSFWHGSAVPVSRSSRRETNKQKKNQTNENEQNLLLLECYRNDNVILCLRLLQDFCDYGGCRRGNQAATSPNSPAGFRECHFFLVATAVATPVATFAFRAEHNNAAVCKCLWTAIKYYFAHLTLCASKLVSISFPTKQAQKV